MTISVHDWAVSAGQSWTRRKRRTPIQSPAVNRELARLQYENRKRAEELEYRTTLMRLWARG